MEKVLNNLLSNAIKHNIPGGLAHIALTHDRTQIHLTISDTEWVLSPAVKKSGIRIHGTCLHMAMALKSSGNSCVQTGAN